MVTEMGKFPWFPMYAGDWFLSTAEMSNAEKGAYIDLLCIQWENGSILKVPGRYLKEWETLKGKFPMNGDGHFVNHKLDKIRIARADTLEKQRLGGIESAKVRGKQPSKVLPKQLPATRARSHSHSHSHTQSQKSESDKEVRAVRKQWFDKFWTKEIWKDLSGKTKAREAWMKIPLLDQQLFEEICKGAIQYQTTRQNILDNKGRIKMAQGWLNDRRWEDAPPLKGIQDLTIKERIGKMD